MGFHGDFLWQTLELVEFDHWDIEFLMTHNSGIGIIQNYRNNLLSYYLQVLYLHMFQLITVQLIEHNCSDSTSINQKFQFSKEALSLLNSITFY